MDKLPRRGFVIWSFVIVSVALVVLGIAPGGPLALVLPTLLVLAFVISAVAGVTIIGTVLSVFLAPETRHLSLTNAVWSSHGKATEGTM